MSVAAVTGEVMGALGVGSVTFLVSSIGLGATTATAMAATAVGFCARLLALRLGAPALVLVMPAVSPMLPGLRIFRGMYESVSGSLLGATRVAQSGVGVTTMLGAGSWTTSPRGSAGRGSPAGTTSIPTGPRSRTCSSSRARPMIQCCSSLPAT